MRFATILEVSALWSVAALLAVFAWTMLAEVADDALGLALAVVFVFWAFACALGGAALL